jgi:hypothetical protein
VGRDLDQGGPLSAKSPRSHLVAEAGVVLVLVLAVVLAACSGGGDDTTTNPPADAGGPSTDTGPDAPPPPLTTTVQIGRVSGKLPDGKRAKVGDQVAHAVDAWFDAAYVGGTYPRTDFSASWPGFTSGAAADASKDKRLMSNQDIGTDISAVRATARRVSVDVLAVHGKAEGATARCVLKFKTDGDVRRRVEVSGRLFLTPSPDGWQVFGYDVTKGRFA